MNQIGLIGLMAVVVARQGRGKVELEVPLPL